MVDSWAVRLSAFLIAYFLAFGNVSQARLGETSEELSKRFGNLESKTGDALFYKWFGRLVRVDLLDGTAGKISFSGVSDIDVQDLLKENDRSGKGWDSKDGGEGKIFYKNKSGDRADFVNDRDGTILRFYSKDWVRTKGTDVIDLQAIEEKSRKLALIGYILENLFSILILVLTITFFCVFYFKLFRSLGLIAANTQRTSESTQILLAEVQKTNEDLNIIKSAVAPNFYDQGRDNPPQNQ